MIVYGRNAVREALRGPRQVSEIWVSRGAAREPWLADLGQEGNGSPRGGRGASGGPVLHETSGEAITERCGSDGHQGVCAAVSNFVYADADALLGAAGGPFLVALDQVQDPQNLGSIARSAECAGAAGLILPERRAAEVTPAVCKASAGAVEHLPIAQVRNLADFLTAAKARGLWCYGADGSSRTDYRQLDWSGPLVLVLGSEGSGLRPRVAASCDGLVSLPLRGRIESLSVGAAAAVLLYAAAAAR